VLLAAVTLAACGGTDGAEPAPGTQPAASTAPSEPTPEQLAARRELLADIEAGKATCWCTAAERARDRVERGLAEAPGGERASSKP
jgi:hypothetical protein